MEKVNLKISTKNIPTPSKAEYCQNLLNSIDKFFNNARWKAYFYLHPDKKSKKSKNNFGYRLIRSVPIVPELKEFEAEV